MTSMASLPYDYQALGTFSQRLASAIFSAMPQLQASARMVHGGEQDGPSLQLVVPSPTTGEAGACYVWVDEVATPTIGFGPWHMHKSATDDGIAAIVDSLGAVLQDTLVIVEDLGGDYPGAWSMLDLREPEALMEHLTSRWSPGRGLLKSWSGKADHAVSVDDLSREISGSRAVAH